MGSGAHRDAPTWSNGPMASCFSHPAVPLALACWAPSIRRRSIVITACLLSSAPDLDSIGFAMGVPYAATWGHRGATHSIVFAVLVGMAVAWPLARRTGVSFARVATYLSLAMAPHGVIDMATNGGHGIAVGWPFDPARHFLCCRPIEVSPIGIRACFSSWGVEVLRSELFWIWLPCAVIGALGLAVTRRRVATTP